MTHTAPRRRPDSVHRARWLARLRQQLSERIFADGDAFARENLWEITKTTGRWGFGTRTYRDPRFEQRTTASPGISARRAERRRTGG
jgi:hypothetical protein